MKAKSLGFIGAGRVTRIFLQAFKNHKVSFRQICMIDPVKEILEAIMKDFPNMITTTNDLQKVMQNDVVFIALHPSVIMETLDKIKPLMNPGSLLVSLAPKITMDKISMKLDGFQNIARMIPNAPSMINEGYNPVAFSKSISDTDREFLIKIFEVLGKCVPVEEHSLEAYAIITAMSPTYFWFQYRELFEIGRKLGLSDVECRTGIAETIKASVNTLFYSGMTPEEVTDLIPVKPIAEYEAEIRNIYNSKLLPLYEKIKP